MAKIFSGPFLCITRQEETQKKVTYYVRLKGVQMVRNLLGNFKDLKRSQYQKEGDQIARRDMNTFSTMCQLPDTSPHLFLKIHQFFFFLLLLGDSILTIVRLSQ